MRKYKDVCKRILGLVLTVCMLNTLWMEMPVYAAETGLPEGVTITLGEDLNGASRNGANYIYNRKEIRPSVEIQYNNVTLVENEDYKLSYSNNTNAGTAVIKVTGLRDPYVWPEFTKEFTIEKQPLQYIGATYRGEDGTSGKSSYVYYTGKDELPAITSVYGILDTDEGQRVALEEADYKVSYVEGMNKDVGAHTFKVELSDNSNYSFSGTAEDRAYNIYYNLGSDSVKLTWIDADVTYNGKAQTPRFTLSDTYNTKLGEADYTTSWSNNVNAGTATLTLKANQANNYRGSKSFDFTIKQEDVGNKPKVSLSLAADKYYYIKGGAPDMTDQVVVKIGDTVIPSSNYRVAYLNANPGTVGYNILQITGLNNMIKETTLPFYIYEKLGGVVMTEDQLEYTGDKAVPDITVKSISGDVVNPEKYSVKYYTDPEYTDEIEAPTRIGEYYIQVTGVPEAGSGVTYYEGTLGTPEKPVKYNIVAKSLMKCKFNLLINGGNSQAIGSNTDLFGYYDGAAKILSLTAADDKGNALVNGTDFTYSVYKDKDCTVPADDDPSTTLQELVNVGTYYIKVVGVEGGNYAGSERVFTYTIKPKPISPTRIEVSPQTYTGTAIRPDADTIKVYYMEGGKEFYCTGKEFIDVVSIGTNIDIGTNKGSVTIKLKGNFVLAGNANNTGLFDIVPRKISDCDVNFENEFTYNGLVQKPTVRITDNNGTKGLTEGRDFTVTFFSDSSYTSVIQEPVNAGTYYMRIAGMGIYAHMAGSVDTSFVIRQKSMGGLIVTASNMPYADGAAVVPEIKVMDGAAALVQDKDYEIEGYYEDAECTTVSTHSAAGRVFVRIKAKDGGNYEGTAVTYFFIGDNLSQLVTPFNVSGGTYNFDSHYQNIVDAIDAEMAKSITDADAYSVKFYTDKECLNEISDTSSDAFKNAGSVYFKVFGTNGYYGSITGFAAIARKDIAELDARVNGAYVYNGLEQTVAIATQPDADGVILQYPGTNGYILTGNDYSIISSATAVNAGTATLTLKAADNGNFTGTKTVDYTILPKNLNDLSNLKIKVDKTTFSNDIQTPNVTLTYGDSDTALTAGRDYQFQVYTDAAYTDPASNEDLTNAGTLYVKVIGIGNYKGELASADCTADKYGLNEFVIEPKDIGQVGVDIEGKHYFFSNSIPEFHVVQEFAHGTEVYEYELAAGTDYTYSPTNIPAFKVGKQTLTITGQGNFKGTRNSFFYYDGNLSNSANQVEVTLGNDVVAYNPSDASGEGMRPGTIAVYAAGTDPKMKLIEGTDYEITYRNNKVPGLASVVITGKEGGSWVGSYVANFKITGSIADAELTVPTQAYTGSAYSETQPIRNMQVVCDGKTLVEGTDYRIKAIGNAKDVTIGGATVTIEGIGEYFSGEKTVNFDIKYDLGSSDLVIDIGGDVFSYTGSAITPIPVVKYHVSNTTFDTLTEGADYTVTYRNNTEVAAANGQNGPCVVITAAENGKLMGTTRAQAFSIDSIHLEDYEIVDVADSYTYTGKMIKPPFRVCRKGGTEVIDPKNYDVYYETDASNPSLAPAGATETIRVIGKGNYDGVITKTFTVTQRDLTTTAYTIENQVYSGEELKPEVKFTFNDENGQEQTLTLGTDYTIAEYKNNINAADKNGPNAPYAAVLGLNSCSGTLKVPFTIEKKSMEDLVYSEVENPQYKPLETKYEPALEVYMSTTSDEPLKEGTAYNTAYFNNDKVAAANGTTGPYIQVTPKDTTNFTGVKTIPFSILARDIAGDTILGTLSDSSDTGFDPATRNYPFTAGAVYTPDIRLTDNSGEASVALQNGVDYTFAYSANNNQVGTAYITVTGKGNYTGTRIEKYTIGTLLSESSITVKGISDKEYNGLDTKPADIEVKFNKTGEILKRDVDYMVKYYTDKECLTEASAIDLIHAGTVYVAIIGTENLQTGYVGTAVYPYEITRKSLTSPDIEITGNEDMDYTGSELKPVLTLKDTSTGLLIDPTQYEIKYENNIAIGTASATITATETGNYKDSITVYYKITKHNIDKVTAEAIPDQMYTGDYIIPDVTLYDNGTRLVEGVDYLVTNGNNLRAGESWVIIQGIGNYDETKRVYFNIVASLEQAMIDDIDEQLYTGKPITPKVNVACGGNTLVEGEDYKVTYANNVARGDASVTITPLTQYYTGTIVKKFKITNSLASATVTGIPESVLYNGSAITPIPIVNIGGRTLTQGVDYTVAYTNNIKVGTASVIIEGIGIYSGRKTVTFKIAEKSINNCTVYAVASQFYTGRPQTPPVVVKDGLTALAENRDYVLSYSSNVDVGVGRVTITGRGDYKGEVTKTFAIVEQKAVTNVLIQNKNSSAGTFDVVIDGVANYVTKVQVPVWTKADQSDIVWYNAARVDVDTFIVHVNQKNHKNNVGVYNIHVYTSGINRPSKCSYTTNTTFGGGYEYIFDYNYYVNKYPDIARAFKGNTEAVFNHFVNYGMKEGRQGIANFNVQAYRARYADLRRVFGTDLKKYYNHYRTNGKQEGRIATGGTEYQNPLTVYNGVDYRLVYDYNYYVKKYPDIAKAFKGDEEAVLQHFVNYGMKEGRQAKETFSVNIYKRNYADLRSAFGNNLKSYYMHYISNGYREKRKAY